MPMGTVFTRNDAVAYINFIHFSHTYFVTSVPYSYLAGLLLEVQTESVIVAVQIGHIFVL